MNISLAFVRLLFTLLCMIFATVYALHVFTPLPAIIGGIIVGLVFSGFLIALDLFFKRFNLRSFNIAILGVFFGYLMGEALNLIFGAILQILMVTQIASSTVEIIKIALFLFGIYLGLVLTLRAADELYVSIPFIKFAPQRQLKKDYVLDASALSDPRILDLSISGIFDHHIVVPRFIIKELYHHVDGQDENQKVKARQTLETLRKLEELPELALKFNDTDFPEVKDSSSKLIRLARLLDANVITADITQLQTTSIEGIKIINIHSLSNALKPLAEMGEHLKIKIQRHGKEPNQGVGYLEDGTMIVVNGGGDYIGQTIDVHILSVKHTSSGRMIFCNVSHGEKKEDSN